MFIQQFHMYIHGIPSTAFEVFVLRSRSSTEWISDMAVSADGPFTLSAQLLRLEELLMELLELLLSARPWSGSLL
jgi:hypothetical protein